MGNTFHERRTALYEEFPKESEAYEAEFAALLAENEELKDRLKHIDESWRITLEDRGAHDEEHCSCVPVLRAEIDALQAGCQWDAKGLPLTICWRLVQARREAKRARSLLVRWMNPDEPRHEELVSLTLDELQEWLVD